MPILNSTLYLTDCLDILSISYDKISNNNIELHIDSIESIHDYLLDFPNGNIQLGNIAFIDLIHQIKYFEKNNASLPFLNEKNIAIINKERCLIINPEFYKVHKKKITLLEPYSKDSVYYAPEIRVNTVLPFECNYTVSYYNLVIIILKICFNEYHLSNLEKINYTRLYWSLKRCLNEKKLFYI
jgi:hypothetical protein